MSFVFLSERLNLIKRRNYIKKFIIKISTIRQLYYDEVSRRIHCIEQRKEEAEEVHRNSLEWRQSLMSRAKRNELLNYVSFFLITK